MEGQSGIGRRIAPRLVEGGIRNVAELAKADLASGASWTHVPYKGASPAIFAVISSEADVAAPSAPSALPLIKTGELRALVVNSDRRIEQLPGVPTLEQAGVKHAAVNGWIGLHAPSGTPSSAVVTMETAVLSALREPELREQLEKQAADLVAEAGKTYDSVVATEITRWRQLVEEAGITVQ